MKELLIMAKSLGGGGSEVALIELINALPEELYNITLVLLDSDNEYVLWPDCVCSAVWWRNTVYY